jgi:hypothetical protein
MMHLFYTGFLVLQKVIFFSHKPHLFAGICIKMH